MNTPEEHKIYLGRARNNEKKIRYPLYQNCYANALEALWDNFKHSEDAKATDTPQGLTSNIIAFMGARGCGKTTALWEFNKILKNYEKYKSECGDELFHDEHFRVYEGCFHVLPSIDASLLEKDEDIIELIWANMYKDFMNVNSWEKRQRYVGYENELADKIGEKFDEIYKNYKRPREDKAMLGDNALVKLKHLSSSHKTKEDSDALIKHFLQYMQIEGGREDKKAFLVVTVDDLDLNMGSGYRILEDLYRYLNNPSVIVLIAVDFTQMKSISDKYFTDKLYTKITQDNSLNMRQAERLSSDFLVKVLPLANRIYMPDNHNILKEVVVVSEDRIGDIKQFTLGKIAQKMGIYYDAIGLKQHFCIPQTQRTLVQYNEFLEMLYDTDGLEDSKERRMQLYDSNHERFNRDISENMAPRLLDLEQLEIFKLILDRNIDRRAEYAVNFLNNRRISLARQDKQQKLSDSVDEKKYYYSDLLEAINKLGRADYGEKSLVHCVLASFTSEMTREYYSYIHNPKKDARIRAAKRLKSFLGNTFGGTWFKDIGPMVEEAEGKGSPFEFQCACQGDITQFGYGDTIEKNKDDVIGVENIAYLIPILECAFLLFPNCYNKNGNKIIPTWQIDITEGSRENKDTYEISISIKKDNEEREVSEVAKNIQADFDVFGFVGREIEIENTLEKMGQTDQAIESLVSNLDNIWKRNGKCIDQRGKECLKNFLRSKSIWNGERGAKIYFPFYNLDMAYNVIKRVRRKIKEESTIYSNKILQYLQQIYGYVVYELQKEDEYYQEINRVIQEEWPNKSFKSVEPHFKDDFSDCPYIKAVGYQYWDEKEKKWIIKEATINEQAFNKLINKMLKDFTADNDNQKKTYDMIDITQ